MEAISSSFLFLANDKYEIPYFQRPYVWGLENWQKLIDNITNDDNNHFIGSIILQESDGDKFLIIDGQQRITTICVLLKACKKIINEKNYDDRIDYILFHAEAPGVAPVIDASNLMLKVNHSIETDFKDIMLDKVDIIEDRVFEYNDKDSSIINCYKFFTGKKIDSDNENGRLTEIISINDAKKIVEFLLKKNTDKNKDGCIIRITLGKDDNAQRIFDTINAEGVRLTSVDIIKNNLFERYRYLLNRNGDDEEIAFNTYNDHWREIFENKHSVKYWGNEITTLFNYIGTILKIFDREKYKEDELHKPFKNYIEKITTAMDMECFIEKVLNWAIIYKQHIKIQDDKKEYSWEDETRLLNFVLDQAGENTLIPYVILLYSKNCKLVKLEDIDEDTKVDISKKEDLYNALRVVRSIALRFYLSSDTAKKIKNFNKKIISIIDSDIIELPHKIIFDAKGKDADISDENFVKGLKNIRDNSKGKLALFLTELHRRHIDSTSPGKEMKYNYSLEHIIAQTYENNWGVESHPVYAKNDDNIYKKVNDKSVANELRKNSIYDIGNMLLLTGPQNSSQSDNYIAYKVESKYDITKGKKKDRWSSYETCNDLLITHEVVEMYKKNKKERYKNELWCRPSNYLMLNYSNYMMLKSVV